MCWAATRLRKRRLPPLRVDLVWGPTPAALTPPALGPARRLAGLMAESSARKVPRWEVAERSRTVAESRLSMTRQLALGANPLSKVAIAQAARQVATGCRRTPALSSRARVPAV
jgi:hypothetical protein